MSLQTHTDPHESTRISNEHQGNRYNYNTDPLGQLAKSPEACVWNH